MRVDRHRPLIRRDIITVVVLAVVLTGLGLLGINVVSDHRGGDSDHSLRLGNPSSVTISNHPSGSSQALGSITISTPDPRISQILDDLNRLSYLGDNIVSSCPDDNGSFYELRLTYPGAAKHTIDVETTGCRDLSIDGAWAHRRAGDDSPLRSDLDKAMANKVP